MAVYKDECIYTFDNQYSPHGVDVCLSCFIGTSPDPTHDFTAAHSRLTGHNAFLNIKRIVNRNQSEIADNIRADTGEPQPKRLHIRDEGNDNFTEVTAFKSLAGDKESDFTEQIHKVLSADSYAKVRQTEEWLLDLQPCEHVAMFESTFDNSSPQRMSGEKLSKCSTCDFTSNSWSCLCCGNSGCGRRQFDGSGGNSHALQHYEVCGEDHASVVKLGSITPEGHVDVYCYACNDDILDPNIAQHLAHWGIDIAKQTKREKSMTELQLEQNMNWDFATSIGGEPVHGPGFTGMKNSGNSCYMNSVIQSLFDIPEFSKNFSRNDPKSNQLGDANDLLTQLNKMWDGLSSGRYDVVNPQMLKYLIGKDHPEFATTRQQDAFEYLTHFVTLVSNKYKGSGEKLFGFMSERRIFCNMCHGVRYVDEPQENLSISVPIGETDDGTFKQVNFEDLLEIFTAEEAIQSKCPRCKNSNASSSVKFKSFPLVLVVNVRRFRIVNWVPEKVDVPVLVPSEITSDKYLSTGPRDDENIISQEEISQEEISQASASKCQKDTYKSRDDSVAMLVSMGFDEKSVVAGFKLAHERNLDESDLELIINLIVNGDAADYAAKSTPFNNASADAEQVATLESMGFSADQANLALKSNKDNIEAAVEWLFAGKYEEAIKVKETEATDLEQSTKQLGDPTSPANYKLQSTICHKGASIHVGHYVAEIHKPNGDYLYNDERVTKNNDTSELQNFAYIYMFHRM